MRRVFENSIMLQDGEDHERTRGFPKPVPGSGRQLEGQLVGGRRIASGYVNSSGRRRAATDVYELAQRTTFEVAANVLNGLDLGAELAPRRRSGLTSKR